MQRLSFQQTLSPKPSSTFPTSFSTQKTKATARKQPQPASGSEQNSRPLRTPEASALRKPSLAPCPATPLTCCRISYLRCPEPLLSASPEGCGVQQDHLGHLLKGWAQRHCPGPPPRGGSQPATLSQRPGSKISFLEDLAWALPSGGLRETASIMRISTQRGLPAQSGNSSLKIFLSGWFFNGANARTEVSFLIFIAFKCKLKDLFIHVSGIQNIGPLRKH